MSSQLSAAVGSLLVGRNSGTTLDADLARCLESGMVGGICIFKDNAQDLDQLLRLNQSIWQAVPPDRTLLLCIDQEGGAVQRLDHIISPLPSMLALGELGDEDYVRQVARVCAAELKLLGFNCVLAPVLDVNTNEANPIIGTRAFGSDPHLVSRLGAFMLDEFNGQGILAVGKHFPGHGDTAIDSHWGLPVIDHAVERLEQVELLPFRENMSRLKAILTAHVCCPSLSQVYSQETIQAQPDSWEAGLPASLSYAISSRLLRENMGFGGLVFTDDLTMKAVAARLTTGESAVLAFLAGADQILVCADADAIKEAHHALMSAVISGMVSQPVLYERVAAREKALSAISAGISLKGASLRSRRRQLSEGFAHNREQMIAVNRLALRHKGRTFSEFMQPLSTLAVFVPEHNRYAFDVVTHLERSSLGKAKKITEHCYSLDPGEEEIQRLASIADGQAVLILTFRTILNPGQAKLARELAKLSSTCFLVVSDLPSDLAVIDEVEQDATQWQGCLWTFDPSDLAMEAAFYN